jgi:hypothetical protein
MTDAEKIYEIAIRGKSVENNEIAIESIFRFLACDFDSGYFVTAKWIVAISTIEDRETAISKINKAIEVATGGTAASDMIVWERVVERMARGGFRG